MVSPYGHEGSAPYFNKSKRQSIADAIQRLTDDQLLGNRIKAKLIAEPGIRSLNIDVDVAKGVVTLSGIVDSLVQKRKIIEITKTTPRIIKVVDFIKVKTL